MESGNKFLIGAIVIAGALIAAAIIVVNFWGKSGTNPQALQGAIGQPAPVKVGGVELGDLPFLGNPSAKVSIVEFGDFQCPFCRQYFEQNEPKIINEYVKTGKAKLAWRDFELIDTFPGIPANQKESLWAAEAARCANDQSKFWQYHDYLFQHQGAENSGTFSKQNLEEFAANLGLNTLQFNQCLESDKYADAVKRDTDYGKSLGVDGTPATFVNGTLVTGAVPYDQLKTVIDAALK